MPTLHRSPAAVRIGLGIVAVTLAALVASCDAALDTVTPGGTLLLGTWGGENAGVIATDSVTHVHVACTFGDMPANITLNENGRFTVDGTFVLRAYPVMVGPTLPAQFSGQVRGHTLTLAIAVNDTVEKKIVALGPISVQFGETPRMGPCPICLVPKGMRSSEDPAVRSVGSGAQTWVLLSGVVGGIGGFRSLEQELLQQGFRVVTIDPFHLALDSTDVSFTALARYTGIVLDRLGVRNARVVGHSNGAGVALRLAAQMPDRVEALYFLDAGALAANRGQVLNGSIRLIPYLIYVPFVRGYLRGRLVDGIRDNMGQREWFGQVKQHEYVDPMLEHLKRVVKLAVRLGDAKEPETLNETIARVRVRIVAILGDAPHASGPAPGELAALEVLGPRLRVIHLPGVGHFPHEEATNVVARYLLER